MRDNYERLIPTWLVLVAVLPTLALWNRATYLTGDSYQYLRSALTLASGHGMQDMSGNPFIFLGPLYSLLVGLTYRFIPGINLETLARLVSLLGATAAVVVFYSLVRKRHSPTVAILSALVFALVPLRIWSGQWVLTNGLALGFTLSGTAVLFRREKPGGVAVFAAGALFALAYLTRSDALVFTLAGFGYLLLFAKLPLLLPRVMICSLFLSGALLIALPYHGWIYSHTGSWTNRTALYNLDVADSLYHGIPAPMAGWHFDPVAAKFVPGNPDLSWSAIAARYAHSARIEITRLTYLVGPRLIVWPLLLVGLVRFLRALWRRQNEVWWQAFLLSFLFVLPLFHIEDRYLLPVIPVLCFWLVDGAVAIGIWAGKITPLKVQVIKPVWISCLLVVLLLGSYAYRLSTQLLSTNSQNLPREVAVWMSANHLADGRIMAQDPALAFYRGTGHVWLPDGPTRDVIRFARQQDVRYIFVSSGDLIPVSHKLLPEQEASTTDLLPRGSFDSAGVSARLFELVPESSSRK